MIQNPDKRFKSSNKITPTLMKHDLEKLYNDNIDLKNNYHGLKDENLKLKTKLLNQERE